MSTPEIDPKQVAERALEMVTLDGVFLDDEVYTPPAAIGMAIPPRGEGPETAGDREPRLPKVPSGVGAIAIDPTAS